MVDVTIKQEFQAEVVGFNGSGLPLGKRTQKDLIDLAILSYNPVFKQYFEEIPSLDELNAAKGERVIQATATPANKYVGMKLKPLQKELASRPHIEIADEDKDNTEKIIALLVEDDAKQSA
jgi:hypothetical protein